MSSNTPDPIQSDPDASQGSGSMSPSNSASSSLLQPNPNLPPIVSVAVPSESPEQGHKHVGKNSWFTLQRVLAIIGVVSVIGCGAWCWLYPSFEPAIGLITSGGFLVQQVSWQRRRWSWFAINLGVIALGIGIVYGLNRWLFPPAPAEIKIVMRVLDVTGKGISQAAVTIYRGNDQDAIRQFSDSYGDVRLISDSSIKEAKISVIVPGFQPFNENVNLSSKNGIELQMRTLDENSRNVLIRVVDGATKQPVKGAQVQVITKAKPYSDVTDSNGLATLKFDFAEKTIDGGLTVTADGKEITNQNITLLPEQLQEIRVDSVNQTASVGPLTAENSNDLRSNLSRISVAPAPGSSKVTMFRQMSFVKEIEPNGYYTTTQKLDLLGAEHPITGTIEKAGDHDFYSFPVVAGRSYALELFNVSNTLGLNPRDYNCLGSYQRYRGLGMRVLATQTNQVAMTCAANGGGDVDEELSFTAPTSAMYVVEVFPHSDQDIGTYNLRVMPRYDDKNAAWLAQTLEPNDDAVTSYPIGIGLGNSITSAVDEKSGTYLNQHADSDWYHFDTIAGKTYVIELFNVEDKVDLGGIDYNCYGNYAHFTGLGLDIYNSEGKRLTGVCGPAGAGDVHTRASFRADIRGTYYIRVYAHVPTAFGSYSLRVLPKYDEGGTRDERTREPDNQADNASEIKIGEQVKGNMEERSPGYSTNNPDEDWYYVAVKTGKTYVVELTDVADTLKVGSKDYNCYGDYFHHQGLGLAIYDEGQEGKAKSCRTALDKPLHNTIEFTSVTNRIYYIRVFTHPPDGYGTYTIQVREK